ncbi:MAG: hypothetical protein ACREBM_06455, partial [Sphingomicrobium sp.]
MAEQIEKDAAAGKRPAKPAIISSTDPASGKTIWSGPVGDAAAEVAAARAAFPGWAMKPLSFRSETLR